MAPTFLRQIVRDLIVSCAWSYKLELRKKTRIVGLEETPGRDKRGSSRPSHSPDSRMVRSDYRALQNALRFLGTQRRRGPIGLRHLEEDGHWKESVIKGFGQDFYDRLTKWKFMSPSAIGLAEHMEAMLKTFKMKPPIYSLRGEPEHRTAMSETPWPNPPVADRSPGAPDHSLAGRVTFSLTPPPMAPRSEGLEVLESLRVVPDPGLPKQMELKLIDVEIEHLQALTRIKRQDCGKVPHARSEFSERSLADASRNLQRAIELFLKLDAQGL